MKEQIINTKMVAVFLVVAVALAAIPLTPIFADEASAAAAPVVVKPAGDSVYAMGASGKLYIQASSPDGGYLTYAWYRSAKQTTAVSHPNGVYASGDLTTIKTGATDLNQTAATLTMRTPGEVGYYYYWCTVTNHVEGDDGLMHTASVDSRPAEVHVLNEIVADTHTVGGTKADGSTYSQSDQTTYFSNFNQLYTQIQGGNFDFATARSVGHNISNNNPWDSTHYSKYLDTANYSLITPTSADVAERYVTGGVELSALVESTIYQEIATVPGKIYEWSFDHMKRYVAAASVKVPEAYNRNEVMALIIGPAAEDTTNTYPYGEVASTKNEDGGIPSDWGVYFGSGTDTYVSGKSPQDTLFYKVVIQLYKDLDIMDANGAYTSSFLATWKESGKKNSDALVKYWSDPSRIGDSYSVTLNGKQYYAYISVAKPPTQGVGAIYKTVNGVTTIDGYTLSKGSYSVPEGQGRTVFGFANIISYGSSVGNILDNISFQSGSSLGLSSDNAFSGDNSISVPTKAGYAFGICEVRGSATTAASGVTVAYDADGSGAGAAVAATPDGSLPGSSWYAGYAEGGVLTFSGLVPGKTYRVAGVPVGAISPADELNTNTDPTQVLDDGYYADTTIPVSVPATGDQMGNISASLYDDDAKARVTMSSANANVQYGLLSFADNADDTPVTAPPVAAWRSPEGGQVVFEGLSPNRKYMLIARPYGYSDVTYAVAAASGVIVWTPVGGFAATVTRAHDGGGSTDTVTLSDVASAPEAFNTAAFEYAIYDTASGKLSAAKDGAASLAFTGLLTDSTYQVVLRPKGSGQSWADAVRVYPYASFGMDWPGEAVMAKDAGGALVAIPETMEYRLYADNAQKTWLGGSDAWRQGSGAEGVPLSEKPSWLDKSVFARLAELGATGATVEYRYKAGYDGYDNDSVSPVASLAVPVRGDGPVLDTDYAFDYTGEKLKALSGKHAEVSKDGGATWAALPEAGTALTALGWNGGGGAGVLLRKAAESGGGGTGSFASNAVTQAIAARPAAPSYARSQVAGDKIKFLGLTAGKDYEWAQPLSSGNAADATWHPFAADGAGEYADNALVYDNDPPSGLDGDYWVREAATADAFASQQQLVSTALMVVSVDFGTATYGYDVGTAGLTRQVQLINGMTVGDPTGDVTVTGVTLVGDSAASFELHYSGNAGTVADGAFTGAHVVPAGQTDTSFTLTAKPGLAASNYTAQISVSYTRAQDA